MSNDDLLVLAIAWVFVVGVLSCINILANILFYCGLGIWELAKFIKRKFFNSRTR